MALVILGLISIAISTLSLYLYFRQSQSLEANKACIAFKNSARALQGEIKNFSRFNAQVVSWAKNSDISPAINGRLSVWAKDLFLHDYMEVIEPGDPDFAPLRDSLKNAYGTEFSPKFGLHVVPGQSPKMVLMIPPQNPGETPSLIAAELSKAWIKSEADRLNLNLFLFDNQGDVLASSLQKPIPKLPENFIGQHKYFFTGDYDLYTYKLDIEGLQNLNIGVLMPLKQMWEMAINLAVFLFFGFMLAFLGMYVIYRSLMSRTTDQIDALASWSDARVAGQGSVAPPTSPYQELKLLSSSFGDLVNRLDSANKEIALKNQELNREVVEKTSELIEQVNLVNIIISEMPEKLFLTDAEDKILFANQVGLQTYGLKEGDPLPDFLQSGGKGDETIWEAAHNGRRLLINRNALLSSGRRLTIVMDITDRQVAQKQIFEAQKLESVKRLAAGVAHDFNNALATIIPCVEVLRYKLKDEQHLTYINSIEKAALRGADVVRRLLTFSRAGDFNARKLEPVALVDGVVKMVLPMAKGTRIIWEPPRELPSIFGDEAQLQQAIINIVINSIDALGSTGNVSLDVYRSENDKILISIEDDGPGIPDACLTRIFEPFYTTKPEGKGSGLGLSVTYGVLERHGGSIKYVKKATPGARFEILLPIMPEDTPQAPRHNPEKSAFTDDFVIGS